MAGNPNFDEILSSTLNNYRKKFVDNVFSRRALIYFLKKGGRTRMEDGGVKIVEDILLTEAQGAGSYSRFDELSLDTSETGTAAEFPWKQFQAPIIIDGYSEMINSGDAALANLLKRKIKQAEDTVLERFNTMLYLDGTGNGGKDWNGLASYIGDHNFGPAVVGNIDCTVAANSKWRSHVKDVGGGSNNFHQKYWRTAFNTVTYGSDTIDAMITTQDLFERYESDLAPNVRYTDVTTANAGFLNLTFKNKPIVWDEGCPAGYTYFLNCEHLNLVGHSKRWFVTTEFQKPWNRDAKIAHILVMGNMTINSRRTQGIVYGQTVV